MSQSCRKLQSPEALAAAGAAGATATTTVARTLYTNVCNLVNNQQPID
jgi:hypothetical protein